MKKLNDSLFIKNLLLSGSFSYWFAVMAMVVLPINVNYFPPFMIAWSVAWIIENIYKRNRIFSVPRSHLVLLCLFLMFYVWQIIGVIYSENSNIGWQNISRRLSLVLFPLILFSPGEMIKQKVVYLLRIFAVSTFVFIVFCFIYAFYRSIDFQNGTFSFNPHQSVYYWLNYFYGTYFSVFQHPSYLAMYVILSIFISFESIYDMVVTQKYRIGWLIISLVLLISLYFLSSRTGMLTALLILPFYFFYKSVVRKRLRFAWLIIIIAIFILAPLALKNSRFISFTESQSGNSLIEVIKKDERIIVWKAALDISRDNLLLGVGTGDVNSALLEEHIRVGNTELVKNKLNAHNQFVEVLLGNGLIGLVLLISIFATMVIIAWNQKNILYLLFILTAIVFFFFESMLNRLAGVSFIALFTFLLLHIPNPGIRDK